MDNKLTTITHFGIDGGEMPKGAQKNAAAREIWEKSSPKFRVKVLRSILDDLGEYEDKNAIVMSLTLQPLIDLRERGVSEEEIMELGKWEYQLLRDTGLSFDEYCEVRDATGITEETNYNTAMKELTGEDPALKRQLSDSEYKTYQLMKKRSKIPDWVVENADIMLFMQICTSFRVGDNRTYLNNVKYLTKEDAVFLQKQGRGDLFGCLCLKPLFEQRTMMTDQSWLSLAGYDMHRYKMLQWLRIDTPAYSCTMPIYSYYKNREWLEPMMKLKTISEVVMYNEGNQLVIGISEYGKPYRSIDYEPEYNVDACGYDCEDPVLEISRNILSEFHVTTEFTDLDLHTKIYFIFCEIAAGSEDWLKALDSSNLNTLFKFYRKGDSLADTLWRFLSAALSLDYRIKKTRRAVGKVRIGREYYSLYDLLGDGSKLVGALRQCEDKSTIEVY